MMESTETNETTALEQSTEIKEEVRQNESQDEQVTEQDTPVQQPVEEEEQPQEDAQQPQAAESETMPTTNIYKTKEEVVARAQQIVENGEASDKQELDLLKQLFYKFHIALDVFAPLVCIAVEIVLERTEYHCALGISIAKE